MVKIKEEFKAKLKALKEYVAIATISSNSYQETNLAIVSYLTKENIPGVYITLNKPFETMQELFTKNKIDKKLIIFIDAVTKTAGGKTKKTKNCLFIGSPENLSDISLAMDQAVRALSAKEKFVFFDSLSTLLLYNSVEIVARFIHFLASKMRIWKVKGIIVSLQKEKDKELINELMQFCDVKLDF